MKHWLGVLVVLGLPMASTAMAVPSTLTIQGHLANGGTPMDGDHVTSFSLYDAPTTGTLRWMETDTIHVAGLLYSAVLGKNVPLPASIFTQQLWLETTVDGTTLTPRIQLTTAPYSQWSQRSDTATVALNGVMTGGQWETDGIDYFTAHNIVAKPLPSGWSHMLSAEGTAGRFSIYADPQGGGYLATPGLDKPIYVYGDMAVSDQSNNRNIRLNRDGGAMLSGTVGIGTSTPAYKLDIHSSDPLQGLNWTVDGGTESGSYVRFGTNNSRGALWIGNATPWGGGPADDAGLLQTTGGWQWNKQLNIMGAVGIGTVVPDATLDVRGSSEVADDGATPNTRPYASFGVTRPAAAVNNSYIGLTKQSTIPWGIGISSDHDFIIGVANDAKQIPAPMFTVGHGGGVTIPGNLSVGGTKCRIVMTAFGQLKMNAVESTHALFMDDEPSAHLDNGRCRINLSPKFLATVTVNGKCPLAVNVTFYGQHGGEWYVERDPNGFTVIDPSGSNSEFSWQVIARQKGYEDTYLDPVELQTAQK